MFNIYDIHYVLHLKREGHGYTFQAYIQDNLLFVLEYIWFIIFYSYPLRNSLCAYIL